MKKIIAYAFLLSATFQLGCTKHSDPSTGPGNGSGSNPFINKIWSGDMNVNYHQYLEPFSLDFTGDTVVEWYHASTTEKGSYKIDKVNKKISVVFTFDGPTFTAAIVNDSTLGSFALDPQAKYLIRSCAVNNTTEQPLANTIWSGPYGSKNLRLQFKDNQKVDVYIDNVYYTEGVWASGLGYLRMNTGGDSFYGVLFGNTIKGIYIYASQTFIPWSTSKQP